MTNSKLGNVYSKLEKNNVVVSSCPYLEEVKAISFCSPDTGNFYIGLNDKSIKSEREELCILMEEQAHYEVGIIPNDYQNNSYSDMLVREKNELRAKKWAVKQLINKDDVIEYLKTHDYIDLCDMAEQFDVTPEFAHEALIVYGLLVS